MNARLTRRVVCPVSVEPVVGIILRPLCCANRAAKLVDMSDMNPVDICTQAMLLSKFSVVIFPRFFRRDIFYHIPMFCNLTILHSE